MSMQSQAIGIRVFFFRFLLVLIGKAWEEAIFAHTVLTDTASLIVISEILR